MVVVEGQGPIAAVVRTSLRATDLAEVRIVCTSLSDVSQIALRRDFSRSTLIVVNGLSPELHSCLATAHFTALNFTAWFGLVDNDPIVREAGVILTPPDSSAALLAARVADHFQLPTLRVLNALHVQLLKLLVNIPGVTYRLIAEQGDVEFALACERDVLATLFRFVQANQVPLPFDVGQFPVERLRRVVASAERTPDVRASELLLLVQNWRGGRVPEAVRKIRAGDAKAGHDVAMTLSHVGVAPSLIEAVLSSHRSSDACPS